MLAIWGGTQNILETFHHLKEHSTNNSYWLLQLKWFFFGEIKLWRTKRANLTWLMAPKPQKSVLWEENVFAMLGGEPVEFDDTAERWTKKSKLYDFYNRFISQRLKDLTAELNDGNITTKVRII